jgi:hypothetical protein
MIETIFSDKVRAVGLVGNRNCFPLGTLVETPEGLKRIEKVQKVVSYNFKEKIKEIKPAEVIFSGKKEIVEIRTSKGIIKCSPNHLWFVKRNKKIIVIKTSEIKLSDKLIKIK